MTFRITKHALQRFRERIGEYPNAEELILEGLEKCKKVIPDTATPGAFLYKVATPIGFSAVVIPKENGEDLIVVTIHEYRHDYLERIRKARKDLVSGSSVKRKKSLDRKALRAVEKLEVLYTQRKYS